MTLEDTINGIHPLMLETILEFFKPVKTMPPDAKEIGLYYNCMLCPSLVEDRITHYMEKHGE